MCVSKPAHKGGYHFFLVLISLMWMACGSYSEKLHVILGSHLELSAPDPSPGNAHYLQTLQDVVAFAARGHSRPSLSQAVGAGSRGHAAVGSTRGEGAAPAVWHNWNMTQVNWLCSRPRQRVLLENGHLCSLNSVFHGRVAYPGVSLEVLLDAWSVDPWSRCLALEHWSSLTW